MDQKPYSPKHKIRIVTAASLFDGHDAAINIMRRIIQSTGCEVIHLGHDRSVEEVVDCAIQEDAQAIAMTSYQGGHNEYFKYMYDLLKKKMLHILKFLVVEGEQFFLRRSRNCISTVLQGYITLMMVEPWDYRG